MTKIVALANQKGGVGKTTTAINLGASIAACERRVLLVDLDPQANATSGLGLAKNEPTSMYPVLVEGMSLREIVRPTELATLFVAPSSVDLVGAEIELGDAESREFRLRDALQDVARDYHYVLIDSPPSLGLLTINGLCAADSVLVPMQCEYFALEGLAHLLYTQRLVRMNVNPKLELGGIVMTQFDGRTTLAWEVLEEVRRSYPDKIYRTLIPRNVRISEAPSHGQPVTVYDPTCRGSQAFRQLAEEVMSR